jgi:hypothetical protein
VHKKLLALLLWPFRMAGDILQEMGRIVVAIILFPLSILKRVLRVTWRATRATYRWITSIPGWIWGRIVAMARAIRRSPRQAYESLRTKRDWLLAKIDYLQSESAKWRTLFNVVKSPYSLLRAMGFSPQMAISFLAAGSAVGSGAIVAEVMEPPSFRAGDAGVYDAPQDAPVFFDEQFNTLRVDLGSTAVGNITIEDTTLGTAFTGSSLPSGETSPIIIGGKPAVVDPAFTETFLETSYLLVDRWRCESLLITNSEANKLIVTGMASDGQSMSPVPGTPRMRAINGGNRAADMHSHDSYFDQLRIQATSSGVNGKVDVLTLTNLYSRGGSCLIDRVLANVIEIRLGEIGGDSDLATKAFQIADSVTYKTFESDSNVEVSMAVPAIQ